MTDEDEANYLRERERALANWDSLTTHEKDRYWMTSAGMSAAVAALKQVLGGFHQVEVEQSGKRLNVTQG